MGVDDVVIETAPCLFTSTVVIAAFLKRRHWLAWRSTLLASLKLTQVRLRLLLYNRKFWGPGGNDAVRIPSLSQGLVDYLNNRCRESILLGVLIARIFK
jgi:hypothetical protein